TSMDAQLDALLQRPVTGHEDRRLIAGGSLLGIEVLDHIIVGNGAWRCISLKDRGVLRTGWWDGTRDQPFGSRVPSTSSTLSDPRRRRPQRLAWLCYLRPTTAHRYASPVSTRWMGGLASAAAASICSSETNW